MAGDGAAAGRVETPEGGVLAVPMGAADVSRTRFESSPLVCLLRGIGLAEEAGRMTPAHRRWLRDARRRLPERARPAVELLRHTPGHIPAFLIPDSPASPGRVHRDPDQEIQELREVSDAALAADLGQYRKRRRIRRSTVPLGPPAPRPRIVDELQDRGIALIPLLTDAMRALYDACLAADWPDIRRSLDAEIAARGRQLAADGTTAVLNDLHPRLSWRPDVLELQTLGKLDYEVYVDLRGEGLTLMPTPFGRFLGTLIVPHRRSVLTYPAGGLPAPVHERRPDPADARLAGLIGRGRAAALRAIGDGVTTSELAVILRVGAPTASAHAAALRGAGLVVTERTGRSVRHRLTGLGADLLAANP